MSEVLEGSYYAATKEGYVNRGKETIKFGSKINRLPVFSRCNELLKSQNHPIQVLPRQKLEEVHCNIKSLRNLDKEKTSFSTPRSPTFLHSQSPEHHRLSKIYKDDSASTYVQNLLTPTQDQTKKQLNEMDTRISIKSYEQKSEEQNSPNVFTFSSSKNTQVRNSLKKNFSEALLKKELQKSSNLQTKIDSNKQTNEQKQIASDDITDQNTSYDDCITQHVTYEPLKFNQRIALMKERAEDKILDQLQSALERVNQLEQKIKTREAEFKINILERQVNDSQTKINQLHEENLKLKDQSKNRSMPRHCCFGHQLPSNSSILVLIVFLLGVLFTKAILC